MKKIIIRSLILLLIITGGIMYLFRQKQQQVQSEAAKRQAEVNAGPVVRIAKAGYGAAVRELVYVGEAIPFQNVTLYAKVSGYVEKIFVDKGDQVKEGQLLATLLSPELDQSYRAAKADLDNKRAILKRDQALLKKEYISLEDEQKSETDVKIAEANVTSLEEQLEYKSIKAPFKGTITARFADPGALVQNATNAQTSALPLVTIAQLDKIRMYIYVEQKDVSFIQPGYNIYITSPENPKLKIEGAITRNAGQLDPHTRMMTTEIDLDNKEQVITPGGFFQVHVQVPGSNNLQLPSEALIVKNNKYLVAVVTDSLKLHFKEVKVVENNGQKILIAAGVTEGEKVALNIGERYNEGQKVRLEQ